MLQRLELNGFKSFAKKTELTFGSSVCAIVGPNGSGKSNVVEAFRFVLGEQSIKSMRGKSGSDLIFKGSKTISPLNRAKASIVFDNKNKIFKIDNDTTNQSISLDFETIEISREVYADGANKYLINNTEVRLKDVHELLASVNIGSSGHHIISQGQADRLLSSSGRDRRGMIEDALGLKIYQIKIKDAEKRLEKTQQNNKEIESLRREIAPHLRYLKKQVEKIEHSQELRKTLAGMYKTYLSAQDYLLQQEYNKLSEDQKIISTKLENIDSRLSSFPVNSEFVPNSEFLANIKHKEENIKNLSSKKEDISRGIGRLEAMIEMSQKKESHQENEKQIRVSFLQEEFNSFIRDTSVFIDQAFRSENIQEVKVLIQKIQEKIQILKQKTPSQELSQPSNDNSFEQIKKLSNELQALKQSLQEIFILIENENKEIQAIKLQIELDRNTFYESQRDRFEVEKSRAVLVSEQQLIQERLLRAREARTALEEEIREGIVLVGKEILSYAESKHTSTELPNKTSVEESRREIERIKIKLEEAGSLGGEEALQEYEEVSARDAFLEKELLDLESGMAGLQQLIDELKETLDNEFRSGIEKINTSFQEFFSLMFGGGNAKLSIVAERQRRKKEDDEENTEEEAKEEGIEIEVSLPHKKVRELTMLSGGERSLTSIALLFAMSQVNPPPFLVLDETDAALDEANSRRYGDMIQKLSEYSQLIVVTHNRETMSRAETIYGVTIGGDGASKILSIKFGEAESYAK